MLKGEFSSLWTELGWLPILTPREKTDIDPLVSLFERWQIKEEDRNAALRDRCKSTDLYPCCYAIILGCPKGLWAEDSGICVCAWGRGVPTDELPWWLSSSFKPKVGLLFETEDLGLCQATTRISALAQNPADDSCCCKMRRSIPPERTSTCRDAALPWEPVGAPSGPLVAPLKTDASSITRLWCPGIWAAMDLETEGGGGCLDWHRDGERRTQKEEKDSSLTCKGSHKPKERSLTNATLMSSRVHGWNRRTRTPFVH